MPAQRSAPTSCRTCGTAAPPGRTRLEGVWTVESGTGFWDCAPCTRAHLSSIEAGLDLQRH